MNSRERFKEIMRYGIPDRMPYFEWEIRKEVIRKWHKQGLPRYRDLSHMFFSDKCEYIDSDLEPRPRIKKWPSSLKKLYLIKQVLNPEDGNRLPHGWKKKVRKWKNREHILMLRVHRGFYLSLGVDGWERFKEINIMLIKDPELVRETMKIQGEFAAKLAKRILNEVEVDAAVFAEPISDNRGALISPKMYEDLVLPSYQPLLHVLNEYKVETIIFLTWANSRLLLPSIIKLGFNCLWACETNPEAMGYRELRREFGQDLRLIGGIDLDVLRKDKKAIKREVQQKVPSLLAEGGYIPMIDGRVREDTPFENYVYYRKLLDEITRMSC